jgi:hypothetical protein
MGLPVYGNKDLGTESQCDQARSKALPGDRTVNPSPGLEPGAVFHNEPPIRQDAVILIRQACFVQVVSQEAIYQWIDQQVGLQWGCPSLWPGGAMLNGTCMAGQLDYSERLGGSW